MSDFAARFAAHWPILIASHGVDGGVSYHHIRTGTTDAGVDFLITNVAVRGETREALGRVKAADLSSAPVEGDRITPSGETTPWTVVGVRDGGIGFPRLDLVQPAPRR